MFKILVKVVIPHLYRYKVSLTSKYMFKSLGKSCYRSLNIGTGISEQILKTKVRLFRVRSISHSTSMFVTNQMIIVKSVKSNLYNSYFSKLHRWLLSVLKSSHGKVYQQAVSCSRKVLYWGEMGSQP